MVLKRIQVDENKGIILRELDREDIPGIFHYSNNEEVVEYLMYEKHTDITQTQEMFNKFLEPLIKGPDSGIYAIEVMESFAGIIGFRQSSTNKIIIWYALDIDYWNKKIMTKSLAKVLQFLREQFPNYSIIVNHIKDNVASQKIIEKLGFKRTRTEETIIKNKVQTLIWYENLSE